MNDNYQNKKKSRGINYFLYELALTIGQSLSLEENCNMFLKKLLEIRDLSYGQLWLTNEFLLANNLLGKADKDGMRLVYSQPNFFRGDKSLANNLLFELLAEKKYQVINADDKSFESVSEQGITTGQYILLAVNDFGILKLYYNTNKSVFTKSEYEQLNKLLKKFAISIRTCLSHFKLKNEFKKAIRSKNYYDNLTGLPNRLLFNEKLSEYITDIKDEIVKSEQVAVVVISIDKLKLINNLFGYKKGDQILVEVAQLLKQFVTEKDKALSRLGSNDFALFLEKAKKNKIKRLVQKIIVEINKPFIINKQEVAINCNIGISVYPDNGDKAGELLKKAELAMQKAKYKYNYNNNYKFYNQIMGNRSMESISLESDLKKALEKREFEIYYQPQIEVASGEIVGLEALLRWNRNGEVVSPANFIPLAEKTGLIIPIGNWVLNKACHQVKDWEKKGFPSLQLAVNISPVQFQQKNLYKNIKVILDQTGLAANKLKLEITENLLLKDLKIIKRLLRELRKLGLKISIDDFGTGFSSLSYLSNLPISELKIDKSFILALTEHQENKIITETIISLGRTLKTNIIAEGVEKVEQLNFLKDKSCNGAQGYLISKPVPAKKIEKILKSRL